MTALAYGKYSVHLQNSPADIMLSVNIRYLKLFSFINGQEQIGESKLPFEARS
jgi:hypothetical protein